MSISSLWWEAYPWKNELQAQMDRAIAHAREVLDDEFEGTYNPAAMMERALVLAAFSTRRMIEKRLVTDTFAASKQCVRSFKAKAEGQYRRPYVGQSGGNAFSNYDFSTPGVVHMKPGDLANEIIHSTQLMVVDGESFAPDGFLIASDWHQTRRLLHLSFDEFRAYAQSVLSDQVASQSDRWDPETGEISSERLGRYEVRKPPA